jgi:hypothetical protein
MEAVTLVVAALAAGATSGVIDALKGDVKERAEAAYAELRGLVQLRVAGHRSAEAALTGHEADPEAFEAPLIKTLAELNVAADTGIVATAQALMELIDEAGSRAGKYNVTVTNSKGVLIGDYGYQVNAFNE